MKTTLSFQTLVTTLAIFVLLGERCLGQSVPTGDELNQLLPGLGAIPSTGEDPCEKPHFDGFFGLPVHPIEPNPVVTVVNPLEGLEGLHADADGERTVSYHVPSSQGSDFVVQANITISGSITTQQVGSFSAVTFNGAVIASSDDVGVPPYDPNNPGQMHSFTKDVVVDLFPGQLVKLIWSDFNGPIRVGGHATVDAVTVKDDTMFASDEGCESCATEDVSHGLQSAAAVEIPVGVASRESNEFGQTGLLCLMGEYMDDSSAGIAGCLSYVDLTQESVEIIRDTSENNSLRQIKGAEGLADIVKQNDDRFDVHTYLLEDVGAQVNGVYQTSGTPVHTVTVERLTNTPNADVEVLVCETVGGTTSTNRFSMDSTNQQRRLLRPDSLSCEVRTTSYESGGTVRVETFQIEDPNDNDKVVFKEVKKYQTYSWGEPLIFHQVDPDNSGESISLSYSDDPVSNGYRQVSQRVFSSGRTVSYTYDTLGRRATETDGPWQKVYDYTLHQGDDGSINPSEPRKVVTYYDGDVVGITYHALVETEVFGVNHERIDDVATESNAPWWDASNLETRTEFYSSGDFAGEIARVHHADGTMTIYTYTNDANGGRTTTVSSGEPSANNWSVVDGVKTVTARLSSGEVESIRRYDLPSNVLLEEKVYSNFDDQNRPGTVTYLDGTTETMVYDCCGLQSFTDREGVVTSYVYDSLMRKIEETRLGITLKYDYDAAGNLIKLTRQGTNQTEIVLNTWEYGLDGRRIKEINGLGGETSISFLDIGNGQRQKTTVYPDGGTQVEIYDNDGHLYSVTGTAVAAQRYERGTETVTGPTGNIFDSVLIKNVKLDPLGNPTDEFVSRYHDYAGRLWRIQVPQETTSGYDPANADRVYDIEGNLSKITDHDGIATHYFYNAAGEQIREAIDINQDDIIDEYSDDRIMDTQRTVVASGSSGGPEIQRLVTRFTTPLSATTENVALSVTSPDGLYQAQTVWRDASTPVVSTTQTVYTGNQRIVTHTKPGGQQSVEEYTDGRLSARRDTDDQGTVLTQTTYDYDTHGRLWKEIDFRNGTTTYGYNDADLVTSVTTPTPSGGAAQVTQFVYDTSLRLLETTLPDGGVTKNEYFPSGALKKTYGTRTNPVEYTYDAQQRRSSMTTWQDFDDINGVGVDGAATTEWIYDEYLGLLEEKRYPDAQSGQTSPNGMTYTYTVAGRLRSVNWLRGHGNQYDHNNAGDVIAENNIGLGSPPRDVTYTYDRRGRLLSASTARGSVDTVSYEYNQADQITKETYTGWFPPNVTLERSFDNALRMNQLIIKQSGVVLETIDYQFDSQTGRLDSVSSGAVGASYAYLAQSHLVQSIAFGAGKLTTTQSYDALNRLTSITAAPGGAGQDWEHHYTYNQANQRTRVDQTEGRYWSYQYDTKGQLTSGKRYNQNNQLIGGQDFEYQFDEIGNRQSSGGRESAISTLSNNAANQLSSRSVADKIDLVGLADPFTDLKVNGTVVNHSEAYFHHVVDVSNGSGAVHEDVTVELVGGPVVTGKSFVPQTPESFQYDVDGNLIQDGRWSYEWDPANRLIKMTSISGTPTSAEGRIEFSYDHLGRRTRKAVYPTPGGTTPDEVRSYVYDGWNLIGEFDASGALVHSYLWGLDIGGTMQEAGGVGGLLAVRDHTPGGSDHYVAMDGNGNVVGLVDALTGKPSATYEYGPFGEPIRQSGPMAATNPFRFSTKFTDDETGFLYYGMRYYNPTTGTWISRDPIEESGGLNLYGFVENDPIGEIDYMGLATTSIHETIKQCLLQPTPAMKLVCLKNLRELISGNVSTERLIDIAICEMIHETYKAAEQAAEGCTAGLKASDYRRLLSAGAAANLARGLYLKKRCDYILPGSIKKGSAKMEARHKAELAKKFRAFNNCAKKAAREGCSDYFPREIPPRRDLIR